MTIENLIADIQAATLNELKKMVSLINDSNANNLVPSVSLLVVGLVSTISDLLESNHEGASTYFFKEVETGLKLGVVEKIIGSVSAGGISTRVVFAVVSA